MLQARDLWKRYGELTAVAGVSFTLAPGEIVGLLGPNGAGKTTTVSMICGITTPDQGEVTIENARLTETAFAAKRRIGLVPQELALYEELGAEANLRLMGSLYGLSGRLLSERVAAALALVGLAERAGDKPSKFSGGMKRRLNIACALVHDPDVLLLDEPTVGVDPQSRVRLLDLVRAQASAGACVLYTTHYMEEAESLCDRLAIVDHGKIIAAGTLAELRALLAERDLLRLSGVFKPDAAKAAIASIDHIEVLQADENVLLLSLPDASRRLTAIFSALAAAGAEVRGTNLTQPSLESLFIKLTGKELRE